MYNTNFFRRKETSWIIDWRKCKMNIMYFWTVSVNTIECTGENVFPSNVKCACYACGCVNLIFFFASTCEWMCSIGQVQESCVARVEMRERGRENSVWWWFSFWTLQERYIVCTMFKRISKNVTATIIICLKRWTRKFLLESCITIDMMYHWNSGGDRCFVRTEKRFKSPVSACLHW